MKRLSLCLTLLFAVCILGGVIFRSSRLSYAEEDLADRHAIKAVPPNMPLLRGWVEQKAVDQMPKLEEEIKQLTSDQLPVINWKRDSIYNLYGKKYHDDVYVHIGFGDPASVGGGNRELYLIKPQQVFHTDLAIMMRELHSYPHLIENDKPIIAYVQNAGRNVDIYSPAQLFFVTTEENTLKLVKTDKQLNYRDYSLRYDNKIGKQVVIDYVNGKQIAICPDVDKNIAKYQDICSVYQHMDGTLFLAGFEKKLDDSYQLIWYIRRAGETNWERVRKVFNSEVLRNQLPALFANAETPVFDNGIPLSLLHDGSVLITYEFNAINGSDHLRCRGLVQQPIDGKPKWLFWVVYHSNDEGKTFNHIWFPIAKNEIASEYLTQEWTSELLYSIDDRNHIILALLNGKIWELAIGKE